ncbi:ABC-2 type transport system permease protein [Capnocytophaga haemolytica]|jgi:ABC transporter, permease protein|uniref:ABC transporter permease n=1 Tax=Capnocytophaga haemolytica TaxID=45243 RepID=A0AAX2GYY5_9FLAO|nr:ABC transporter permease [Capnocytophaga haemolytica]AMD84370.1 ABC transporter permease [Capnocytophaga haemolytica]SFO31744.1 ABC-2 type transport system permease protein [Capnocytophaga haemolytica]SNV11256.1 Inner membrane transport permease ybhR [Capnocytophaga haemolytica]
MRTLRFLLRKEFRQIFRNRSIVAMMLIAPIMQLLILPLAANYEVKNIHLSVVDNDRSTYSQDLLERITASGYFILERYSSSYDEALGDVETDRSDVVLSIPQGFERDLVREGKATLALAVNSINGVKATMGNAYLGQIVQRYNAQLQSSAGGNRVEVVPAYWFNPTLNFRLFIVPAILGMLVTMVCGYMCALNIVKEKEVGTMEQINVTPVKKWQFILAKLVPFWCIGMFVFTLGLFGVGYLVYGIVPVGNVLLLYGYLAVYLVALLGFALLISTYSETQQQAMSVAYFFMMIFILMSGMFTSIDSMPLWAKAIARANPVSYFIEVVRSIVLKGSGFKDLWVNFAMLIAFALLLNTWAIRNYKKTN